MSQGKHIGKVIIDHNKHQDLIRSDGAYLITGGLGGIGLTVAKWLVSQEAGEVILVGRSEPVGEALNVINQLRASGTQITIKQRDIARQSDVADLFSELEQVNGIFHAAGVLADEALSKLTLSQFSKVLAPKVRGTWNLHQYSDSLDLFVLFSSISSLIGVPGQANYAVANEFLDSFARMRLGQGLAATVINWGPWKEVGMAASQNISKQLDRVSALDSIRPEAGIQVMEKVLLEELGQAVIMPLTQSSHAIFSQGEIPRYLLQEVFANDPNQALMGAATQALSLLVKQLREELDNVSEQDKEDKLIEVISQQIVSIMKLESIEMISLEQPLIELGLDSLIAIELRNILSDISGVNLPATILFDHPTIRQLAAYIAEQINTP
ncbi:beta-ketoacyl reductase [Psychrobium sp. nBUS_13]|uniref:beta-ketoacyl reductase n=1 Tax=Psychrobium sp. nBUS_13 TaxID=3395319 RepID=UPI003EBFBFB5